LSLLMLQRVTANQSRTHHAIGHAAIGMAGQTLLPRLFLTTFGGIVLRHVGDSPLRTKPAPG
jgi:hypothetical protein